MIRFAVNVEPADESPVVLVIVNEVRLFFAGPGVYS